MKRHDFRWASRATSFIAECIAVAIGLLLTIAIGLMPALALFYGTFACALDGSQHVAVRLFGSIILLVMSAAFSFATGYMFFASFSGGGAKAYTHSTGRMFAWAFSLLPKPVRHGLRGIACAATNAFKWLARALEVTLEVVAKAGVWIVGFAVTIGLATLFFQGVAALPLSVAVIIGALIIAAALQN